MIVYRIMPDDAIERLELDNSTQGALYEGLKEAVGGYIEVLVLSDKAALVADTEGHLKGLEANSVASVIAMRPLFGPVVAVGFMATLKGDVFTDAPAELIDHMRYLTGGNHGDAE